MLTKRLAQTVGRMDTTNEHIPVRAEGVLSPRYQKLACVHVPAHDEVQLEVNSVTLQNCPLSCEAILAAWDAEMRGAGAAGTLLRAWALCGGGVPARVPEVNRFGALAWVVALAETRGTDTDVARDETPRWSAGLNRGTCCRRRRVGCHSSRRGRAGSACLV